MVLNKGDIVRLTTGETCKVIGLPGTFMSRGSYEVLVVEPTFGGKYIESRNKKWVQPDGIAYRLTNAGGHEPITNFLEFIYQDEEINIIPKDFEEIELVEENGFKYLKIKYKNKIINLLIGENIKWEKEN